MAKIYQTFSVADFWHGLTRPSKTSISLALIITVGSLSIILIILTPRFMYTKGGQLFASSETDYDLFVTVKSLNLSSEPSDARKFVLLGGSTTRAALLENDLLNQINMSSQNQFEIVKLCTARQSLSEAYTLVEKLPAETRGVVVLGISPGMFTRSKSEWSLNLSDPRIGVRSDGLMQFYASNSSLKPRPNFGLYAIDNFRFLIARWPVVLKNVLNKSSTFPIDSRYTNAEQKSEDAFQIHSGKVRDRLKDYESNKNHNFLLLEEITDIVQARDRLTLVIYEAPINPRFIHEFKVSDLINTHRQSMIAFSDRKQVRYVRSDELNEYDPSQFFDWAHLSDRNAIQESSAALIKFLGEELDFEKY